MAFYLVRHAHANWTRDENRPLSPQGSRDAERVADFLGELPITAIISSPYRRAVQTVQPLASRLGLDVQIDARFRERSLGAWGASSFENAVQRTWLDYDFAFPGGESNREAQARAIDGLRDLTGTKAGSQVVVSTHGNLLALILNHYDSRLGFEFWSTLTMPDVYRIKLNGDDFVCYRRMWNRAA